MTRSKRSSPNCAVSRHPRLQRTPCLCTYIYFFFTCVFACMYVNSNVYIYIYVVYVCMYVCMSVCMYVCVYVDTTKGSFSSTRHIIGASKASAFRI